MVLSRPIPIGVEAKLSSPSFKERVMTEMNKDEKVVVAKTDFNVANVIAAIALLVFVLGLLKYLGMSPF
jgi:rRNA maturation endonuclease Nob1